ncbi:MAG TPA: hypothetical protein VHO50_13240 [Bacteroidales bacterium]|nr:hypothetical protein [Bacteroidales bacterium]
MKNLYFGKKEIPCFFFCLVIPLFFTCSVSAQKTVSNSYVFTTGTTIYGGDLGLTYTTVIGPNQDNASSGLIDLPFTFSFLGQAYTQFSVTSNGLMNIGSTPLTGDETSNAMASTIAGIKIAPYWDDLATGTTGYVKHAYYSGTLYINFRLTVPKNTAGAANVDVQVRLTASGGISFYYGSTAAPFPSFRDFPTNAGGYSIGIGYSDTDFASVTMTGLTMATCAFGTANDANTQAITGPFDIFFNPDNTVPTISAETIPNTPGTGNRSLTKTVADAGKGIPTSGSFVPRIYYKKNVGGTYVSTPGVLASGTSATGTWNFTVDHSLIGGVAQGDVIYYFVAAQDQAYNVASNPAGVVATDVNTITTPPASPSSYIIPMDFSGTRTVGTGGDYPSLTNPGGLFEQLSAGNIIGNLTVNIISDLTSETGTIPLRAWNEGPGGPFTVTINPIGARTVSGSSATTGLIYLNGAKNFIIDGLNSGGNSLIISNTHASNTTINFVNGANNIIIRNSTITANGGSVITFGTALSGFVNYNNAIRNNIITSGTTVPTNGISFNGSTTYDSYDNVVDNNKIINFSVSGITLSNGYINTTVSNNEIYNDIPSGTSLNGITLGTYYGAGIYNVFNNYIHDLNPASSTSTGTINGIYYGQSNYNTPNDILNIYNNVIVLDATTSNTSITLNGMWFGGSNSYTPLVYIYYNSIYIGGTGIVAGTSTGLKIGGNNYLSRNTIKNNAIYNARTGGTGKHYGVGYYYSNYIVSDNNDIYVNPGGIFGRFVATDYADLASWIIASAQDTNSVSGNPGFTSPTNLLPDINNPDCFNLNNKAVAIPTIPTDILGVSRSATTPDIGAYEISPVCTNPTLVITNPAPVCSPLTVDITVPAITEGSSTGLILTYWTDAAATLPLSNPNSVGSGTYYIKGTNEGGCFDIKPVIVVVNICDKILNISGLFLEGLYEPSLPGTMRRAYNELGPVYTDPLIADQIIVELHDATTYSTIIFTTPGVNLSTSGVAVATIPGSYTGSYYVTIKHKNSIETTTAATISFTADIINVSFSVPANVFGGNLKPLGAYYLIFGGDVNQNDIVDSSDMTPIDNLSSTFTYGSSEDVNCDGLVDSRDMTIVDNNNSAFVSSVLP